MMCGGCLWVLSVALIFRWLAHGAVPPPIRPSPNTNYKKQGSKSHADQMLEQLLTQEEVHRLMEGSFYPSYVNHGNAVHIQGQSLPLASSTAPPSHSDNQQYTSSLNPHYLHSSLYQQPSPSNIYSLGLHRQPSDNANLSRINSKLMTDVALALLSAQNASHTENSETGQTSKQHPDSQYHHSMHSHSHSHLQRKTSQSTQKQSDHHSELNQKGQLSAPQTGEVMSHGQSSASYNDGDIAFNTIRKPISTVPIGNTVNIHMPDSSNSLHQKKKADMADILTNLQILTILMNQEHLQQPSPLPHFQITTVGTVNSGNNLMKPSDNMPTQIPSQYQDLPLQEEKKQEHHKVGSVLPPGVVPTPLHQAGIYQIQARRNGQEPEPKNYYTYASQFPFIVNTSEETSSVTSLHKSSINLVNSEGDNSSGPDFNPKPVMPFKTPPVSIPRFTTERAPNFHLSNSFNPSASGNDLPYYQITKPLFYDEKFVHQDTATALPTNYENADIDKLIHQFSHQVISHTRTAPVPDPGKPQTEQGLNTILKQLENLSKSLEMLKRKYLNEKLSSSPYPILQNDPVNNFSSEDLFLASLLQSQMLQQSTPQQASIISTDKPYIPAIHSETFIQMDDPMPPAPPPVEADLSSLPQADSGGGGGGGGGGGSSGLEDCMKSKLCSIFIACLVATGTTAAFTIPLLTPLFTVLGKRRRRNTSSSIMIPQNSVKIIESFLGEQPEEGFTDDLKHVYSSFMTPENENSKIIMDNILNYFIHNKEYLLKAASCKIESLSLKHIPKEFLDKVKRSDSHKLLVSLKKILAMQDETVTKITPDQIDTVMGSHHSVVQQTILSGNTTHIKDELAIKNSTRVVTLVPNLNIMLKSCTKKHFHRPNPINRTTHGEVKKLINPLDILPVKYDEVPGIDSAHQQNSFSFLTQQRRDSNSSMKEQNTPIQPGKSGIRSEQYLSESDDVIFQEILPMTRNPTGQLPVVSSTPDHSPNLGNRRTPKVTRYSTKNVASVESESESLIRSSVMFEESEQHLSSHSTPNTPSNQNQSIYLQPPGNLPGRNQKVPPPSGAAKAPGSFSKLVDFYKLVCRTLTEPDIPKTEIINFIAQRCILMAYAGLLS